MQDNFAHLSGQDAILPYTCHSFVVLLLIRLYQTTVKIQDRKGCCLPEYHLMIHQPGQLTVTSR